MCARPRKLPRPIHPHLSSLHARAGLRGFRLKASVLAAYAWPTNGHLMADVARLGYLNGSVLDVTYGKGVFWKIYKPLDLTTHAIKIDGVDFRHLPHPDRSFDVVVLDPSFKLNGTPTKDVDERYGVDVPSRWQDRMQMIRDGMTECSRVARYYLLLKCQAQVVSGHVRWQDLEFANHGISLGLTLVDRFDMLGTGRPQPERTRRDGNPSVQQHAYGRPSSLLVFQK